MNIKLDKLQQEKNKKNNFFKDGMNFLKRTAVSKIVSRGTTPKAGATI